MGQLSWTVATCPLPRYFYKKWSAHRENDREAPAILSRRHVFVCDALAPICRWPKAAQKSNLHASICRRKKRGRVGLDLSLCGTSETIMMDVQSPRGYKGGRPQAAPRSKQCSRPGMNRPPSPVSMCVSFECVLRCVCVLGRVVFCINLWRLIHRALNIAQLKPPHAGLQALSLGFCSLHSGHWGPQQCEHTCTDNPGTITHKHDSLQFNGVRRQAVLRSGRLRRQHVARALKTVGRRAPCSSRAVRPPCGPWRHW